MLYLKASEIVEVFDEYKGEKGKFIKTFALNDKRNKNGWRVTWASIKKNIATFLDDGGRPGIEYVKCEGTSCDLDHTDASTFELSLQVQEPYRVTTLIDFQLDEANHTAYFIHKVHDDAFFERVKNGEIKYVSPSIWPKSGGYAILGTMPNGLPMIDVYEWKGVHDAFVNNPAFGDDAKVTAVCEGVDCKMRLLTAAEIMNAEDELAPLKTVPLLVRHKDKLVFVSVTEEEAKKISSLESVNESAILETLRLDNSFHSCACNAIQMDEKDRKELEAVKAELEEEKKKTKELESKNASLAAELAKAKKASDGEGEEEKEKEKKPESAKKAKASVEESEEVKTLKATVEALQKEAKAPLIAKMVAARRAKGASDEQIEAFEESLKAKSFDEVKAQYQSEEILIKDLTAREQVHFDFPESTVPGALAGKSLEDIFQEGTA